MHIRTRSSKCFTFCWRMRSHKLQSYWESETGSMVTEVILLSIQLMNQFSANFLSWLLILYSFIMNTNWSEKIKSEHAFNLYVNLTKAKYNKTRIKMRLPSTFTIELNGNVAFEFNMTAIWLFRQVSYCYIENTALHIFQSSSALNEPGISVVKQFIQNCLTTWQCREQDKNISQFLTVVRKNNTMTRSQIQQKQLNL